MISKIRERLKELKYPIYKHYLYASIMLLIPFGLFSLVFWKITWGVVKIWAISSLIIGSSAVIQDYSKKGWDY